MAGPGDSGEGDEEGSSGGTGGATSAGASKALIFQVQGPAAECFRSVTTPHRQNFQRCAGLRGGLAGGPLGPPFTLTSTTVTKSSSKNGVSTLHTSPQ